MTMNRGRFVPLMLVFVLMMVLSTACAAPAGATAQTQEEIALGVVNALDRFLPEINLPRLEVSYDADGVPSIFGIKTTTLQALLPMDLSFLNLPQGYVNWFTASNIQHLEVEVDDAGILLYANGMPLPYLAWDDESIGTVGEMLASMNVMPFGPVVQRALPLVRRLGVDLVLHFPVADGNAAIAVRDRAAKMLAQATGAEPSATIQVGISYTSDGLPTVLGMTSRDLLNLGIDLTFLELPQATLDMLGAANLQSVQVVTQSDGISLMVNGHKLPGVAYSEEHLQNAVSVYEHLYGESALSAMLRNLLPVLESANLDVTVALPGSASAD